MNKNMKPESPSQTIFKEHHKLLEMGEETG